jgi:hypothetical protein
MYVDRAQVWQLNFEARGYSLADAFAGKCDWRPIEEAPFEEDLELFVTDLYGSFYGLRFPCRLTAAGWISSASGTSLTVTPIRWKPHTNVHR